MKGRRIRTATFLLALALAAVFMASCGQFTGAETGGSSAASVAEPPSADALDQEEEDKEPASSAVADPDGSKSDSSEPEEYVPQFTDGTRTVPPTELKAGDEFLGWTLTEVEATNGYYEGGEPWGCAIFEGEVWVKGRLVYETDYYPFGEIILFYPEDDSIFPRWASDTREGGIWTSVGCSALFDEYDPDVPDVYSLYFEDLKSSFGFGDEPGEYACEALITKFVADSRPMATVDAVDILEVKAVPAGGA
ncbi:MAG: hypothetical protein PHD67_06080 [Oscillospiraceae bacterium]|nr:hypothetical protein [Oscillospiraceae bacterium]